MAEQKKGFDWVLVAMVLAIGFLAGAILSPKSNSTTVYVSNTTCPACSTLISNESQLSAVYLYPIDCKTCNTSRVNALISSTGVPFMSFMNDAINSPQLLVTFQNISTIARASNDFNLVNILCIARNQKACQMRDSMSSNMQACMARNNIPTEDIVYYYADWCGSMCNNMNASLKQLEETGEKVTYVKEGSNSPTEECMKEFTNYAGGLPQFICPRRSLSNTGAMDYNSLEKF